MGQVTYFLLPPFFLAENNPFKAKKVPFFENLKKCFKIVKNGHIVGQKFLTMCTFFLARPI
jgi:hypothetical protein